MGSVDNPVRDISNPHSLERPNQKGGLYYYPDYYKNKKERTMEEYLKANDKKNVFEYDNGGIHQEAA